MPAPPRKCSHELAVAIIDCWCADANADRISRDIWGEHFRPQFRIRTLVPLWNKLANNALWDGNKNMAYKYLIAHGLAENEATKPSANAEILRARRNYAQATFSYTMHKQRRERENTLQTKLPRRKLARK